MKLNIPIKTNKTVSLPKKGVKDLLNAISLFESAKDEIEDFLIAGNQKIMTKVRNARKEHLNGKVKDFKELAKKYV